MQAQPAHFLDQVVFGNGNVQLQRNQTICGIERKWNSELIHDRVAGTEHGSILLHSFLASARFDKSASETETRLADFFWLPRARQSQSIRAGCARIILRLKFEILSNILV